MSKVHHVPAGQHSIVPYLCVRGAAQAIEFYKKALGAEERDRMTTPDGRIGHATLQIEGSTIMLSDEFPESGQASAQALGGTPVGIMLYVPDVDATFKRAVAAGATAKMPPDDMFWGDRFSRVVDPFGFSWSIATHVEDLTREELARRTAEMNKKMAEKTR